MNLNRLKLCLSHMSFLIGFNFLFQCSKTIAIDPSTFNVRDASDLIGNYTEALNFLKLAMPFGSSVPPIAYLTTPQILLKDGYPSESHQIETSDGYILTYHRIPYGRKSVTGIGTGNRSCVLVMHGLFSESTHWLYSSENNNLPYVLANAGYDVWLGNARGNRYSLKNIYYSPDDPRFWKFGWVEMAMYDLPASIDYIRNACGQDKIFYLGHSMGTTMFYAMASLLPEFNDKIRLMISYAPVAYIKNMKSPIRTFAPVLGNVLLAPVLDLIPGPFTPDLIFQFVNGFTTRTCAGTDILSQQTCFAAYCAIIGCDYTQFNMTLLPVYVHTYPSSTSNLPIFHYLQEVNCDPLCFQDYLTSILTSRVPYDVSNITAPVALFSGKQDLLADQIDVQYLASTLPNLVQNGVVNYDKWSHLDFVFGIDAGHYVYQPTVELMKKY